jgi:hypothetical protein
MRDLWVVTITFGKESRKSEALQRKTAYRMYSALLSNFGLVESIEDESACCEERDIWLHLTEYVG